MIILRPVLSHRLHDWLNLIFSRQQCYFSSLLIDQHLPFLFRPLVIPCPALSQRPNFFLILFNNLISQFKPSSILFYPCLGRCYLRLQLLPVFFNVHFPSQVGFFSFGLPFGGSGILVSNPTCKRVFYLPCVVQHQTMCSPGGYC